MVTANRVPGRNIVLAVLAGSSYTWSSRQGAREMASGTESCTGVVLVERQLALGLGCLAVVEVEHVAVQVGPHPGQVPVRIRADLRLLRTGPARQQPRSDPGSHGQQNDQGRKGHGHNAFHFGTAAGLPAPGASPPARP